MSAPLPRLAASALVALLAGAGLSACGNPAHHSAPKNSPVVHPISALSGALSAHEREQVLAAVRIAATTTLPHARQGSTWSSNVTRVVAAVGSLQDAAAWKQPNTPWQLSNPREADHPVLVVQMFGKFQFSRLAGPKIAGKFPKLVNYDVPELTYVISTLDGARLSMVQGTSSPLPGPAQTLFAR